MNSGLYRSNRKPNSKMSSFFCCIVLTNYILHVFWCLLSGISFSMITCSKLLFSLFHWILVSATLAFLYPIPFYYFSFLYKWLAADITKFFLSLWISTFNLHLGKDLSHLLQTISCLVYLDTSSACFCACSWFPVF